MTGSFSGTVAASLILRDQLLSYANNPDEQVIPITSTSDARINGFWRVVAVDIPTPPEALINGLFNYSIQLTAASAFNAATEESIMVGALMTNASGVVAATVEPWHAVPASVHDYAYSNSFNVSTVVRTSEDGDMQFFLLRDFGSTNVFSGVARYTIPTADYYRGAARVEDNIGVSNPYTIIGTQFAPQTYANWRISNGLVRITPFGTSGISLSWYNAGWGPVHSFSIGESTETTFLNLYGVRMLLNAPEGVIVRLYGSFGTAVGANSVTLDLSLRRGARVVRAYVATPPQGGFTYWRLKSSVTVAYSSFTGGIFASAADSQGVVPGLMTASSFTSDLVNGKITLATAANAWDFGIGGALSGSLNVQQDLAYQYLAAQGERMQVVGR